MRPFCQLVFKAIRVDSPPSPRDRQELSNSLTEYRSKSGLTQREMAARVGVSRKTLQNWERGRTKPTRHIWTALSSVVK
jgi:DNA-binding XRE family transcriptional regulator